MKVILINFPFCILILVVYLFENKIVFDSLWEIDIKLLFLLSYFWIAICSVKIMLALNLHLLEVY